MKEINIPNPWGCPVYYLEETPSTMIATAELDDPDHGTVVTAGYQSRGRGRGVKRQWDSPPGRNLLFTLVLDETKLAHPLLRIPLICGLALTDYLKTKHSLPVQLKWPNDVLVEEQKIAGILCEYRKGKIYMGMGVNCLQSDFTSDISKKATSLYLQGVKLSPLDVLPELLEALKQRLENSQWLEDALSILYKRDEAVTVYDGSPEDGRSMVIRITGLSPEGFLLAEEGNTGEIRQISAGEIRYKDL